MLVWDVRGRTWVDARAGGDQDDVAVGWGRNEPSGDEGPLKLDRRVVRVLRKTPSKNEKYSCVLTSAGGYKLYKHAERVKNQTMLSVCRGSARQNRPSPAFPCVEHVCKTRRWLRTSSACEAYGLLHKKRGNGFTRGVNTLQKHDEV